MTISEEKAWVVGPYQDEWVVIVHRATRAEARVAGAAVDGLAMIEMRAVREPRLDGRVPSMQALLDAGFPETWDGLPTDLEGYILDCKCSLCQEALSLSRAQTVP